MSSRPDPGPVDSGLFPVADAPADLLGDLTDADLKGRDLRRMDLRGHSLAGARLEGARLDGADLRDVGLSNANLSDASLVGTRLDGADLSGADLTRADLSGAILDGATLERAILHDTRLSGARVHNATWTEAEAREGDWTGIDLRGSSLGHVDFKDLDLRGAVLTGVRVDDSDWARVRLSVAWLDGLVIGDCTLEDVEVRGAHLEGAEVRFANLDRVDFEGAALDGVTFESVAFKGCRFTDVKATGMKLERCAGLAARDLARLREAGAEIAQPLPQRLWRALGDLPGGRVVAVVLLLVAGAFVVERAVDHGALRDLDVGGGESDVLDLADDATRARWQELEALHESTPAERIPTLSEMAAILESLALLDEAEERLHEAAGLARLNPAVSATEPSLALGAFLLRHGRHDEAFDVARQAIDEAKDSADQLRGYLLMARTKMLAGDLEGATSELSTVTGTLPLVDAPIATWLDGALLLEELGEVSAALALLGNLPPAAPRSGLAEAELLRADMLVRAGNPSSVVATYDRVLSEFTDLPLVVARAREARTSALSDGPDPETEARQLEVLAGADDPELAIQGELGRARLAMRMEKPGEARAHYERAILRFPEHPALTFPARRELADLHLSAGRTEDAIGVLEAAERTLDDPDALMDVREDLARAWETSGDFKRAKTIVGASIRQFADDPELVARAKLGVAGIADKEGELTQALRLYREVSGADIETSMTAAALFGEATLLRRTGKPADALPLMDRAMEVLPEAHPMRGAVAVERAETLVELGQGSADDLESMLTEARDAGLEGAQPIAYGELLLLLAAQLMEDEAHEDALAVYERVAESTGAVEDPGLKHASTEGQVAALMALDRKHEADSLLGSLGVSTMSSGEADDNCDAGMSLARSHAETGEVDAAADGFKELLGQCRSPVFLVVNLPVMADVLVAAGREEEAGAMLAELRDSEIPSVGKQAAQLELGRLGSVTDLEGALEGPDRALASLARIERGEQLATAGRLAEAEPLWQAVLDDESSEPVPRGLAMLGLARLEMARDKPMAARGFLEEAKVMAADAWIVGQAEAMLAEIAGPQASPETDPTP